MKPLHLTLLALLVTGLAQGAEPAPLRLTHRQALQLGSSNLLQARIAREVRAQIQQLPEAERGAFDWLASASAADAKAESGDLNPRFSGLSSLYLTNLNTTQDIRSASLGLSKLDAIGGTLSLNLNSGYNSAFFQINNQTLPTGAAAALAFGTTNPYSGSASLSYTQPLLRGFGAAAVPVRKARLAIAAAEARTRQQADQVVNTAGTFGYDALDRASRSLCDIADGLLREGRSEVAPVAVHVRAMRLFSPLCTASPATVSEQILAELGKVAAHYNFTPLG